MTELEKMIAEFDRQNGTVKTQLSTDNSTPETTDLASMIAEFDRQNANLSDDKQEEVPTKLPKTNEWGEPIYPFEKPVEVEGARLNDFLTPTIFEQKPNAKSETELPKAIKEDKPYNPEGLLPIAKPGPAEMPQSFTSPKVFEEFTPEEKLMLDVDKATDNAFNAAQEEATKQMVTERKERGAFGVMDEFGEGVAEKIAYRQRAGADAVIKRTFESISADDINSIIEDRVANNEEFKAKKQAFDDEVKRIMPNSNDNLSDAEVEALFANMTPEEREVAEKQIAETTQALEALQAQFATDVEGIYKSESKDIEAQINNRIINRLAKQNLPKNDLEYIGKAIYNNSLVGTLYEIGLNAAAGGSGTDYIVSQQALAQAKPSAIAKVVGGAGAILADGAIFGALGAGGSLAGIGVRNLATKVVAGQIARKAAVSATNSAVKATARRIVEKNVLQQFASSAAVQAATLGGYNGLLTAAQETLSPTGENGAYNWRNILTRFGEGLLTGIALGGVSVGTSAAKGAMYRARPDMAYTATGMAADLGVGLAGFTAENAAFLGIGSIVSGEEITAEAIGESFATLGLLKGIGALKRVAKGEKLMQQPDFVERTISDLKFTKEEMDAMRKAGVDMEQIDIVSEAVREVLNTPNKSQIAQETISSRSLMDVYNSVMASREVPISAKIKLQYIVNGTAPRIVGATSLTVSNTNGVSTVKAYDANSRLVQVREFENMAKAESFVNKAQPLLERNSIIEGEKVLRGGQIAVTIQQAIEQYAKENPNTDARTLFTELMIDLGYVKGEVPASSRERVDAIKSRIKEQFVDPASQLVDGIARKYGTTVESVYRALNIKPDLRTVRESQLVKAYVDGLKQFNESMSGPVEAEQARYAEQVRPQIEQGKREVEDAERETAFVRESLNEAAKRMATADGKQIAIVRLENGEQVAVHTGRIVLREDGTIDHKASEQTIVIKRIDAEGNEQRDSVGIDDIAEVIEQGTPEEAVEASMSVLEAQATKKLSLDKALSENGEQGVEVVAIDGTRGKVVGIDENGAYILRAKGESGKEVDVPISINDIEAINAEQPATTEQAAVADAVEKVVEDAATEPVEVVYDDDFPPLTEADMAPQLDADKIQWEKLSPEDYTSASAMLYGDATTLADSHIYHTNSRAKLAKAKQSVAEQQKVIDKLNSRFATLSSPAEAQKLRKQVAAAEQEKAKREQAVKNIEEQMAKYAHAMRKYGVEVATEDNLLAERAKLEEERNALLEADKELDRYEQEEATKGKKTIANTEANRKYIEQLYADRLGVSPAQAGPRQAILWDLANGAIKLHWDNVTTDSGAVQKGLAAELGLSAAEKRIYKAVTDNKNGQSVDAYVHDLWQNGEWGQEISTEELKDELLGVLQSTPNGSLALKELADMSGAQADLEAQISLGKGDIQRKLEEADAKLAKNAQQMADFRKRINDAVQKLESGEPMAKEQPSNRLTEQQASDIIRAMQVNAEVAREIELTPENWRAEFGEDGIVKTPIGEVKMGDNQFLKLAQMGRNGKLGMVKPTLENPDVVVEDFRPAENAERDSSYVFVKAFTKADGSRYYYFTSVTVLKEGKEVVISNQEKGVNKISRLLQEGNAVLIKDFNSLHPKAQGEVSLPLGDSNRLTNGDNQSALLGINSPVENISENKDTTSIPENQISEEKFFGNAPISEDIPFMIEQTADKSAVSESEQNFNREVFDAFAGHLGETLGAESVVTDAAEANRVLEWHQAVGERLRTAVRKNAEIAAMDSEYEQAIRDKDYDKALSLLDAAAEIAMPESKVRDNDGKLIRVTHYTNAEFTEFEPEKIGSATDFGIYGGGFYFSNKPHYLYGNKRYEGYLNLTNPFIINGSEEAYEFKERMAEFSNSDAFNLNADVAKTYTEHLKAEGYDGVIYNDDYNNNEYVAFYPNQFKLADFVEVETYDNNGNIIPLSQRFNFGTNDIRFAIEAYHGSGADFEKFDHSFMSTGEGAQAYGYGTYVTTRKGIAENYAETIGGNKQQERRYEAQQNLLRIRKKIADNNQDIEKRKREIQQMQNTYAELKEYISHFNEEEVGGKTRYVLDSSYIAADEAWPLELPIPKPDSEGSYLTYEEARSELQKLQEEIDSTQALIDSSKARVEKLKPLEEAADKEWKAMKAPDRIRELNTQIELHEVNLKSQQISLAAMQQRVKIKQAEFDYYNEQLAELERKYGVNSPEYKEYVFKNDYIESEYKDMSKYIEDTKGQIGYLEKWIADEKAELARLQEIQKPFRNLYTVEVPDNTGDNYLSWDKEVPATMIERINNYIKENYGWKAHSEADLKQGMTGEQVYNNLTRAWGKQAGASLLLSDIGFTGIEYPAQYTTGGRADGAKNYVIFNADDVKIVDHVQYFKTPNGEVYGFVYEDKIYLDPTNIDPKAPVHEYTELWCREVAKANEALWKRGKELVKQTKVWEEVNADENYKNQSEDLRASEAWSRIIADEMMGKAREYGSKGLMAKLRGWLRSFWKTVKSVVEKWTKKDLEDLTVDQFKKMTMADFINKVDPRKWNAKKPKEVSKSLVGIHNISLDKLQKALKQGGLANPSVGVIDIAKQSHDNYGEYSFILPKNLVDAKRTKGNAGTFIADAWTPVYPQVHKRYSTDKGSKAFWRDLQTLPKEMHLETRNGFESWKEGRNSNGLAYMFLFERGKAPEMVRVESKYPQEIKDRVGAILGEGNNSMYNLSREEREQLLSIYIDYEYNGDRALFDKKMARRIQRINEVLGREDVMQLVKRRAKMDLESINEYGYDYDALAEFVRKVATDIEYSGTVNDAATNSNALSYIKDNNLTAEFESWKESLADRYDIKEYLFAGYTPSGRERWIPNTIENASNLMNKEGLAGATGLGANFGHFVASIIKPVKSLDEIRENKSKFVTDDKAVDEFREKWTPIFFELGEKCQPDAGGFADYGLYRLTEAAQKSDPGAYLKKEYGIELSKEDLNKLSEMITAIKETFPARYFETKFQRPVMFNEFAAVVAPDTMPESVEQQLRDAGLAIYKYNPDVEGDRRKATLAATASEDIRFMIIGEKGAAALDQAEEATTRLDNLAVAREMEASNRDAKAIKLATGWERGADGKWRYEIDDFKLKSDTTLAKNEDNQIVTTLGEVIDDEALFTAFPELRKLSVVSLPNQEYGGHYQGDSIMPHIALGNKLFTPSTKRLVELEKEFDKDMSSEQEDALMSEFNAEVERAVAQPEFYTLVTSAAKKVLVHEVQHAIQRIEGFARGGSWELERPDNDAEKLRLRDAVRGARAYIDHFKGDNIAMAIRDGKKYNYLEWRSISPESQQILLEYLGRKRKVNYADFRAYLDNAHKMTLPKQYGMSGYRKFAGEVESRNAEARMYMTPEERRATLLSETEDVAREDQIFLENNLGGANMLSDDSLAKRVKEILDDYDNDGKLYSSPLDIANGVEAIINDYGGKESTTSLENILADFRAAQSESRSYGDRMDAGGEDIFENELRRYVSNAERTTFSASFSESVEAPTRKPRKSAAEKSLEKIESLREQLQNKKRSMENTLADVYNFLTSKDIAETMAEGVGKAQYRSVIKNAIEAIGKAYNITDAEEKRKVVFRYLGEIDDNLSQMLTRQRLNEVTEILDKAIYGYTAQGVRTGKRIDEHTREIFDILRNAIGEPVEEERDERGYRKPVHYRLKNRTEAGDITSSFRLRTQSSNDVGVIAKLRSDADKIINSVDYLDTATISKAAQLEYTANLLEKYDNTLQLNEAIGQSTDEIAQILDNIDRVREKYKAAAVGSEERKNLYGLLKQLKTDLESEKMNRANLRHRYASMLKTFTTGLEQLDEKGASEFVRAEQEKAESAIKWRKGIYDSIKNPNAPVLPFDDYDRKGKKQEINWKGLNTRAKINESAFMATFAEMSRDIDINSIPGQWLPDGWYYQFMLAPGGYMERTAWRYKTQKALREELDAEILKLSGDKKTDDPYKLFAALAQEPSGMTIQRMAVSTNKDGKVVGGYQENIPLTIGQLLYMRNTLRQPNGFAGYNAWGFSETYMQNIVEYVEAKYPQYCRFFDWVVLEFLPKLYDMQDAIYFKKFGTHLPKTAFYFPFVRDKRMVGKVAEVGEGEVSLPSSVTGNIVERVKTSAKMDLEADAFSVLQDHIKETLDWCAYVELTDKFNNIATSKYFESMLAKQGVKRDKLKEVYEIAVGQGKINTTDNTTLTKTLNAISKGLVAGNIVLNPNAAIKQIVSATATLGYSANPKLIAIWAKNFFVPSVVKTGIVKVVEKMKSGDIDPVEAIDWKVVGDNWKWAIENIPTLRERWEGREAGFEVLKSHSFDSWDKLTAMITNAGLAPNAFVDMLTCSNAAKTVYEYEYPRLLERGRSKKEAHREACVKAAIFINETQQSSLNGFLSSFQSGGGLQRILGVGLGAYQNSSMAFARNERFALANMLRMANSATRNDMQLRQVAAYKELGVEDAKAVELAKQDIKESYGQQVSGFVHNGVLNNYIWKIAGVLLGSLTSAGFAAMFDKDEWNKLWKNEKFRQELASAVSAETIIWQVPLLYNSPVWKQGIEFFYAIGEGKTYSRLAQSPVSQNIEGLLKAVSTQWIGVKNEITGERETKEPTRYDRSAEWLVASTLIKAGLGVNPDLVVRMAEGVNDMMKDGVHVEDVMNVLSSPRGLTRAIAGEPRPGESKKEYLDRMSYIYRQVNAGSGEYDKKFVSERTKEYIDNKDNELYRTLGIVPREERILEQRVKAIRKQLLFFDRSDEGVAEFRALPEADRKKQIEIAKRYDKITKLTKEMYQGILPFDEAGVSKRKQELQKRHDMMREVYDMWIEYNNK